MSTRSRFGRRAAVRGPEEAGVHERDGLDRQAAVIELAREQAHQRSPRLQVDRRQTSPGHLVEYRALGGRPPALVSGKRPQIVAAHQVASSSSA